ncbi:MAG: UvrD-helicase domain-containing protein, partial [Longimicrobiales bacterium]
VLATDLLRRSPGARRGLGERWRRLLVDEFQDTDPLQAELLFLLASDPDDDPPRSDDDDGVPWARLVPRPGALFVVGDPKQSIYRFRRADIALYGRVRRRFEDFGRVVRLEANFRSTAPVGDLVAGVFGPEAGSGALFPDEGTERQAGYAPLRTQPMPLAPPASGVFRYEIPEPFAKKAGRLVTWEASALADWIRSRVDAEERSPDDFLILTRTRRHLAAYARALEARNLPVLVSGSGVGIEDELRELRTLLRALVDPGDPLGVLATLEGLFFGLDPEQLLTHVEAGGSMDYRHDQPPGPVADALARLREWWEMARRRSADAVVDEIVASVGLLPWAASGELGGLRAGALAFTLDLVRTATVADDASLAGALEALALVLDDEDSEVESPLEPGRGGAVRVMNLHKAKGLEAPVVVLACPTGSTPTGRPLVVERDADGTSVGWCAVEERRSRYSTVAVAAPRDWAERQEREVAFELAEDDRLLYVAVTRAAHELVVGMKAGGGERGPWEKLEPWLRTHASPLDLAPADPDPRPTLAVDTAAMRAREVDARDRRQVAAESGYVFETVTGVVRADGDDAPDLFTPLDAEGEGGESRGPLGWTQTPADGTGPGGYGWGNAVHATLEAALSGLEGSALAGVARTALLEHDRPVVDGEPEELEALLTLVERVRGSEFWERALAAEARLTEQPFVLEREDGRYLEGVIDLAFREPDGWVIVDYKTAADDRVFALRLPRYREQVALYAEAWRRLTGEPVIDTVVWRVG